MNFYKDKYVIITGGSEGIGKALAIDLTKAGADVSILSRSVLKLEQTRSEMEALRVSEKQRLNYASCDVTQFETVKKTFDQLIFDHKVPDILMNVAGYAQPGYIHEQEIHHFDDMMNLIGWPHFPAHVAFSLRKRLLLSLVLFINV